MVLGITHDTPNNENIINCISLSSHHYAMELRGDHWIPTILTHATPINNQYIMVLKIVHCYNLIQCYCLCKELNLLRNLNALDASPRKTIESSYINAHLLDEMLLKHSCRLPTEKV